MDAEEWGGVEITRDGAVTVPIHYWETVYRIYYAYLAGDLIEKPTDDGEAPETLQDPEPNTGLEGASNEPVRWSPVPPGYKPGGRAKQLYGSEDSTDEPSGS